MHEYYRKLNELAEDGIPFVSVWLVDTRGSTPHAAGGRMLVVKDGLRFGTVGGGRLEHRVLQEARAMLSEGDDSTTPGRAQTRFLDWSLNKDVGMTCGGRVKLYLELFNSRRWPIHIFGAGHVCRALTSLLTDLDCDITVYDSREEWLDKLPNRDRLRVVHAAEMESMAGSFTGRDFVLLMTMGHAADYPILSRILRGEKPAYLGVIGSASKRAVLLRELASEGLDAKDDFFCPMGLPLGSNHPREIAVSIAAQLLQERDRLAPPNSHSINLDPGADSHSV